jgi:hypothetical protein
VTATPQDWAAKVEKFADEARAWTSMRDEAIRQLRAEGASLREIGKLAKLSHGAIAKILAR